MKKFLISIIVIVVVVLFFIFGRGGKNREAEVVVSQPTPDIIEELLKQSSEPTATQGSQLEVGPQVNKLAPDFELNTYDGKVVRLSDFRGKKPVFLNFWAGWCPFCVEEMPLMAEVQDKFKDQYLTIGVNRGESLNTAKKFSDKVGVTNRLLLVLDPADATYGLYGGFAMPYSLFIDKNGVIRDVKLGPLTPEELEQKIQKIL